MRPLLPPLLAALLMVGCASNREKERGKSPPRAPPTASAPGAIAPVPSAAASVPAGPAVEPAPAPPPYDLAADLAERRALAEEELGRFESEVVEGVFLVIAPGKRGALAGPIDITKRALAAYFNGRFSKRPERAIAVYLFPASAGYDAYCKKRWQKKCDSPYGFYLSTERKIIMNVGPGVGTLTHELVHPLVEADFPDAPDWLNEGIASLFEQFYLTSPGQIHGGKNWRHPRLLQGLNSKKESPLAGLTALFGMSDEVFRGEREDLHYASARYLCQWLDQKKMLWPFYQRWRDTYATDPTGEKAFREIVGMTPAEADVVWRRWVRAL